MQLLAFISITSGAHHPHLREAIRQTWLLPCIASPLCDYRFFVDLPRSKHTHEILSEHNVYQDMSFRDSCALMTRHHDDVHYGNAPPVRENLLIIANGTTIVELPDYHYRRSYKMDWKICFLRYCLHHDRMAQYHVFVEDDSFVCTQNLLHQVALLSQTAHKSFRTGTSMFDGFDDSSTFMTRDIAMVFAKHYMEDGLNCSKLFNHEHVNASLFLSW